MDIPMVDIDTAIIIMAVTALTVLMDIATVKLMMIVRKNLLCFKN